MSGYQQEPWSNNPNAPKISHRTYAQEKAYFAGALIAAILYGMCKAPLPTPHLSVLTFLDLS